VCALGLVELQRTRERVEDGLGDAGGVAALEQAMLTPASEATSSRRRPGTRRGPLP
jgi:hypothetical protein